MKGQKKVQCPMVKQKTRPAPFQRRRRGSGAQLKGKPKGERQEIDPGQLLGGRHGRGKTGRSLTSEGLKGQKLQARGKKKKSQR